MPDLVIILIVLFILGGLIAVPLCLIAARILPKP